MVNEPARAVLLPAERIVQAIRILRGQKVLLDADLALLYGVETRRLNEQVRRNRERFPADFMFQLTANEFADLKSQFATSSWGGRRKLPYAFTEHGTIIAATVLNSVRALEMSIYIVRVFVQLRELLASNKELTAKLDELEHRVGAHDRVIVDLVNAIRELMQAPEPEARPIGFVTPVK